MLVNLFSQCAAARHLLMSNGDLKRKWSWSVEWLHEELERGGQRTPYTNTPGRVPVVLPKVYKYKVVSTIFNDDIYGIEMIYLQERLHVLVKILAMGSLV
jgi:hypothetical protein